MRASSASPMRFSVSGVNGEWSVTKSDSRRSVSMSTEAGARLGCLLSGDVRIVGQYIEAERQRLRAHGPAYPAEANNA